MLNSLKDKLHSVQGNLSTSLRGISFAEGQGTQRGNDQLLESLDFNAGVDVLEKFQANWAELRAQAQDNATQAQVVDELIGKLHKHLQVQWRNVNQISTALSRLPEVMHEIDCLNDKIETVDNLFADVEKALLHLEDLIEIRELQERQLDHRFQLALYKEKKLSQLENARLNLAREHAQKVAIHEARQQRVQRERQEAFEQQFKQDLSIYKETNLLPKVTARDMQTKQKTKLEDVVLEGSDGDALSEFLSEVPEPVIDSAVLDTPDTEPTLDAKNT